VNCAKSDHISSFLVTIFLLATALVPSPARAAIAIDANISVDQSPAKATVATPTFSTSSGNELLLAFVAADFLSGTNTIVSSMSGAGLTWTLVVRTNAQNGTSEIWQAFSTSQLSQVTVTATLSHSVVSSMTVLSLTGVNASGAIGASKSASASKAAPTGTLVTTQNSSWVFAVGNDWDNAIARTVPAGQSLVHQALTSGGDTYWVQMQNSPAPLSGTSITINDTAPTGDRYNLSMVEVLASAGGATTTSSISGILSPASLAIGSTVTLTLPGGGTMTTSADGSGNYSFGNLANGSYTVTPTKTGQTFSPGSQNVSVGSSNISGVNFTMQTWGISGSIGTTASGTTVQLSGSQGSTTHPDASGNYTFSNLPNGNYTITPINSGFTFNPVSQPVFLGGANVTNVSFAATANPTWSISGTISPSSLGANIPIALSGSATGNATTDNGGNYSFGNLRNGSYTVTPTQTGETFTPSSQPATINNGYVTNLNFAAQIATTGNLAIDSSISTDVKTAATTVVSPTFSTNTGNELLLAFITADYLSGTNTTVTNVTGGSLTWVLVRRTNAQSGSSEVWRAYAPSQLVNASVTATLSQTVLSSITVVSFTGADATGTNGSGAIGATATANEAPGVPSASVITTRNNSWVFGVGNDYDKAIARTPGAGQTLIHQDLTSAGDTYWVQRQNLPSPASGTVVSINDTAPTTDRYNLTVVEVLPSMQGGGGPTPPTVNMASPLNGAIVSGQTAIAANASSQGSTITGVQFLLDQNNLGAQIASAPYAMTWDTTTATVGSHSLAAVAYTSGGLSSTSPAVNVTVDNSGNPATVGSWSAPVKLPAVAVNLVLLKNNKILFYQDGTTPTVWDYVNNIFTSVPAPTNLFCSGHAALADGRILVIGGYGQSSNRYGIPNAEIFDPATNAWTLVPEMAYSRWYPTATTLSDGRILVTGGWQSSAHTNAGVPEIYDPLTNAWTQLTKANNPFETYPFIYQLTDGRLVHVNGSEYPTTTDILDLTTQTWSTVDPTIRDGGSSVMYLPDKIMKAGSASDSGGAGPSSNTAFTLDMSQPSPTWHQTTSMAYARTFLNLTELPDGTVLATGGETDKNGGNTANAVYPAELWSPTTGTWTTMAAMQTPREYHSTALLLPDGRVVQSGMGADGGVPDQLSAEFYSPSYLFKGVRPTISQSPSQITYGQSFFVGTPDAASIKSAVLIRTGAATHFFNMNARFVPVSFTQTTGGLTITGPVNGNQAPPGHYMLFLVNSNGVPSIAPFIQLQ
jgi:hypothetical protein